MTKKIGALWVRKSKDGKVYMSGIIQDLRGDIRIAVFKNDRKEKENHPDYTIVLSDDKPIEKNRKVAEALPESSEALPESGEGLPF